MNKGMIHPGPRAAERVEARNARLLPIKGKLQAGRSVMQAVTALFAEHRCNGGVLSLDGVTCAPMRFVLPALSSDGLHAAWYSNTFAPDGRWTIRNSTASIGQKDGETFLHCHGIWSSGDKTWLGHLLPLDTIIADDVEVAGLGSVGTWFQARPDAETAFTLFTPEGGEDGPALFVRILPGEDVVTSIENVAAKHGIHDARLHAVGSIDHIHFAEGHRMDCLATELRFDGARLRDGCATIPIDVVDIDGNMTTGTLTRGDNPVGVTLELLIEPEELTP